MRAFSSLFFTFAFCHLHARLLYVIFNYLTPHILLHIGWGYKAIKSRISVPLFVANQAFTGSSFGQLTPLDSCSVRDR